jgi:hypothetical protein
MVEGWRPVKDGWRCARGDGGTFLRFSAKLWRCTLCRLDCDGVLCGGDVDNMWLPDDDAALARLDVLGSFLA